MTSEEITKAAIEKFGHDPLYLKVLTAGTPEKAKIAMETLTSIRGQDASDRLYKFWEWASMPATRFVEGANLNNKYKRG